MTQTIDGVASSDSHGIDSEMSNFNSECKNDSFNCLNFEILRGSDGCFIVEESMKQEGRLAPVGVLPT